MKVMVKMKSFNSSLLERWNVEFSKVSWNTGR
jgi:hypothetical protein